MTNKKFLNTIFFITLLWLELSTLFIFFDPKLELDHNQIYRDNKEKKQDLKQNGVWNLTGTPIIIDDNDPMKNWSYTASNYDWCSGEGTFHKPYLIENITIDGQFAENCIQIKNSDAYFIIRNCSLYNSSYNGIMLENVNNGRILENNFSSNYFGVYIEGSNNSIKSNFFENNSAGILSTGDKNVMSENKFTQSANGILTFGLLNTIKLNDFNNIDFCGIFLYHSSNNTITQNSVYNINDTGIFLEQSLFNNISKNELVNNSIHGIFLNQWVPLIHGFEDSYPGYNWISENKVINNSYGITLNFTGNNDLINNTIKNSEMSGIKLFYSNYVNIIGNAINGSYNGINLNESDWNNVIQNTINNNFYGISLTSSHGNSITNNTLHYNTICIIENDNCLYNEYNGNDCIETKKKGTNDIISILTISLIAFLGLTLVVSFYLRYKRK